MTQGRVGVIVRADGSPQMGTGHVYRCAALAQALLASTSNCAVVFVTNAPCKVVAHLGTLGLDVKSVTDLHPSPLDASFVSELFSQHNHDWVHKRLVLDGYHFEENYTNLFRNAGVKVFQIDDFNIHPLYASDFLLNHNAVDGVIHYEVAKHTVQLIGLNYALLRQEFWQYIETPCVHAFNDTDIIRVLVTFGGADPVNATSVALAALRGVESSLLARLDIMVIAGAANPHMSTWQLDLEVLTARCHSVRCVSLVECMADTMGWASFVICASGGTLWEALFMGCLPCACVIADNQEPGYVGFGRHASPHFLGPSLFAIPSRPAAIQQLTSSLEALFSLSKEEQVTNSDKFRRLVDGKGAMRVAEQLLGP